MNNDADILLFRKLTSGKESQKTVPLAFLAEAPDILPLPSTRIAWSRQAAALLRAIAAAGKDSPVPAGRSLPYASLRAVLQVEIPEAALLEADLGAPWVRSEPGAFLHVPGETDALQRASRALRTWTRLALRPWAERVGVSAPLVDALDEGCADAFTSELHPVDLASALETGTNVFRRTRHLILQEIGRSLEGVELFEGLGPVRRIIRARGNLNTLEFITWPHVAPTGGMYSMRAAFTAITLPYLDHPVVTVRAARRLWLDTLPSPQRLQRQRNLTGYLLGRDGAPVTVEFSTSVTQGIPDDPFSPEFMTQALHLRVGLGQTLADLVQARVEDRFVGIAFSTQRDRHHTLGAGASTRDNLDMFDVAADRLSAAGFRPIPFREPIKRIRQVPTRSVDYHKALTIEALIGNFALTLGRNALNEDALLEAARTLMKDGEPRGLEPGSTDTVRKTLEALRQENQQRMTRTFGDARQTIVVIARREDERRLMREAVRGLFSNAVDVEERALPANVHGLRTDLPAAEESAKERFAARVAAWRDLADSLSLAYGRCHALVQVDEWYGNRHEDRVNKAAGRFALATIADANVQYLLPCEGWRGFANYLHRIQAAVYDLVFGHSALISEIGSLLEGDFPIPATRPKAILGISLVTQTRQKYTGGQGGQICLATRVDAKTGRTAARIGWHDGTLMRWSHWEPFFDAMKRIATLEGRPLGANADASSRSFQSFVEAVIDDSVDLGDRPVIFIDSTSAAKFWPWLTDSHIGEQITIGREAIVKNARWAGARIVRIRQNYAPRLVQKKTSQHQVLDSQGEHVLGQIGRYCPTITDCTVAVSGREGSAQHYWITSGYQQTSAARGLSVYRELEQFTPIGRKQHGTSTTRTNLKGIFVRTERGLFKEPYRAPRAIDATVAFMQPEDDADRIAHLVASLRTGYGHTSSDTALPAPLSFESKARDYMVRFAIDEADDDDQDDDAMPGRQFSL